MTAPDIYAVTITAKPGAEGEVAAFYQDLEPLLREADGFIHRQILQAKPGTMADWVMKNFKEEDIKAHNAPEHDHPGVHFIIIEQWESVDHRMRFTREKLSELNQKLYPLLLPVHSHEFYQDVSVK